MSGAGAIVNKNSKLLFTFVPTFALFRPVTEPSQHQDIPRLFHSLIVREVPIGLTGPLPTDNTISFEYSGWE